MPCASNREAAIPDCKKTDANAKMFARFLVDRWRQNLKKLEVPYSVTGFASNLFHKTDMLQTMKKLWMGSFWVLVFAFLFQRQAFAQGNIAEISRQCASSVVTMITFNENDAPISCGTGFFLDTQGHVVTNHHVLAGAFTAIAKTIDQRTGQVLEVIKDDPDLDLLVARTSLRDTMPVVLGDSGRVFAGQCVFGLANPRDFHATQFTGEVIAIREAENMELIQMTVPVLPGCSGEPIFELSGKVIGIATAFVDLGEDLNFALPVKYLNRLKPVRREISALPAVATRFEAALRGQNLVEVRVTRLSESAPSRTQDRMPLYEPLIFSQSATALNKPCVESGVVFFKNGKTLLCDRAWKRGKTVFLVIHGKNFAVGYDEARIEMRRSFGL
jgi:hypothetical protein